MIEQLQAKIDEQTKKIKELELALELNNVRLNWLEEQNRLLLELRYGSKSEKIIPGQLSLFNEAEELADDDWDEEPIIETDDLQKKKPRKKRKTTEDLLKQLPIKETIEHQIEEDDRLCPHGHGPLQELGKEITYEIVYQPAEYYLRQHVFFKYACKPCEVVGNEENKTPIVSAPTPNRAIPGSMASPSILAHVIDQKYTLGLPLYRQEQQFNRIGVDLSRQTLANWMIGSSNVFEVLYNRMIQLFVQKDIAMADETPVQVLHEPGKAPTSKSYMWVYRTGKYDHPIIIYDYQPSRSGEHPETFLKDFKGYLHSDGYQGYNNLEGITRVGCMAHARRGFVDALKALPKQAKRHRTIANKGLSFISQLYKIEQKIRDLSIEERLEHRIKESKPVMDAFSVWLHEQSALSLPKSKLGQAIQYTINQWGYLENYLLDGRLEIDNNRSERAIKPFVMGRKAWLFSNTPKGARASAILYSIVETAKENKLKTYEYFKYLLENIPNIDIDYTTEIDSLLPWSTQIPEEIRLK